MKKTLINSIALVAAMSVVTVPAFAQIVEEEPPVVVEPRDPASHSRSDMAITVGISDQTIYGADGKPIVAPTTGLCD